MLSNSHPPATANEAMHCLKRGRGYKTNDNNMYYILNFNKVWSGTSDGRFGKLFVIMDAYNFDKSPNSMY